jgi:hypothetical protein
MSCTIATEADTSSNQASKDPGHCVVAIVTSVKFYRKKIFGCRACGCDLWLRALPKIPRFPISSDQRQKWPCAQPTSASEATHFRLSLPLFHFSQIVLRSALNELDFQP